MENTMLIVDDNEMNQEILNLLFSSSYTILTADNRKEAMDILESCKGNIDIVLLDLVMEELDGFEVLRIRQTIDYFQKIPVVVITASGSTEDQVRAFELGANDYINKPFIPEIVVSRVENVMASRSRMISIELEAEKFKSKSEIDPMTKLLNKATSEHMIDRILSEEEEELHALILIDIDNFKSVNDTSGHLAGDHTIKIVADLLSSFFRKSDVVGRIGGDEFIVLMKDVASLDVVKTKIKELIQIMKYKPNLTIPENVSLSIGFVSNEKEQSTYLELFEKADSALYLAKSAGKARYQEYGKEVIDDESDDRPIALLISRNRGVCSTMPALVPNHIKVIECLDMDEMKHIKKKDLERVTLVYADISDSKDSALAFFEELKKKSCVNDENLIAICQEGDLKQYQDAIKANVSDLLTFPLESSAFKRRMNLRLEKLGLVEKE